MRRTLKIKDYILLTAALTSEILQELHTLGGLVPSLMELRYGFVPPGFKRKSYYPTVSRMISVGDIKRKVDENGKVYLEITSKGQKNLRNKFPLFFRRGKKWDGKFTVVIFDIPERNRKARRALRLKLKELGFGMLQKSVWVSPYHFEESLKEFLFSRGLSPFALVFSAERLWVGDVKALAERVWRLRKINKGYKRVINILKKSTKLKDGKEKDALIKAHRLYLETLSVDPLLPEELLPPYWKREKAINLIVDLTKTVRSDKKN